MMQRIEVTPRIWQRILNLRSARGNETLNGHLSAEEEAALQLYGPLARRDAGPLTLAQIGQSLDGRIATPSGDARDVSGPDGLSHLHRLRALVDGVVIGVRTALHDDPRLTVRHCEGGDPARIVIDPQGRLPDEAMPLRGDGIRRIIVQGVDRARPRGIEVIRLTPNGGWISPAAIMTALRRAGLGTLLVEGGGRTIAGFLEAGLIDRLLVTVAPVIIGAGPQGLTTRDPIQTLAQAMRPETRVYSLGSDILFDCDLGRSLGREKAVPPSRQDAALQS
ncbi:RibD family protein [Paracoccus sp. NGMCC 1.201697]|uniref:RibD family protein n=1 Tax=Paracoccus broussonetiae subsp. drimophilus TaxID=3373869 RepID=A0ABW7LNT9_9RHOB